ncbi:alpha/beta fold hydrolase [Nocardioides sp.]|uniref:alpha/beta fold hydrolase n=1 Tax=Nocardioides sp. TaxID=35761 RepID=UPI003D146B1F
MDFLLVPGAGGDASYWMSLVPLLEAEGHRAVAVTLPAGDAGAGLAEYADAIVDAGAQLRRITMVAQSMGGFSAPLAVGRLDVAQLVLLNAMIPMHGETFGDWWVTTGQGQAAAEAAAAAGRDPAAPFDPVEDFFHDVPATVRDEIFARGEPAQADRPLSEPWPLKAWPEVETRVVVGADDRLFPPEFQRRVARERLGLDVTVLPGGHLIALAHPAELTQHLIETASVHAARL